MKKLTALVLCILAVLNLTACVEIFGMPVEEYVRNSIRSILHSREFEIEKEPDDYGIWETYKITVPASKGMEKLEFHAIYAIRDDIWESGQVETDYYDVILKYCYDSYEGEKSRITLNETESEGLHKVRLLCVYDSTAEIDASIQEIKDFGIYADSLNAHGFRLKWTFQRNHPIICEDGVTRNWNYDLWSFDNIYKSYSLVRMTEFQKELEENLHAFDLRTIYQLSPETEVYDESGRLIELESLPGSRAGMLEKNGDGSYDRVFEDIWVVGGMLPIKHFYTFCNELQIPTDGDASDYTVTVTEGNETHEYYFSYSFYDDIGFYYLKDGEKKYNCIWCFSLDHNVVSEITGMPLRF